LRLIDFSKIANKNSEEIFRSLLIKQLARPVQWRPIIVKIFKKSLYLISKSNLPKKKNKKQKYDKSHDTLKIAARIYCPKCFM
jgi:hypothetical protein